MPPVAKRNPLKAANPGEDPDVIGRRLRHAIVRAGTARETYLAELAKGLTLGEVAEKYGVTKQAVSQLTTNYETARKRYRRHDAATREPLIRGVRNKCSICKERGHTAANPDFHPVVPLEWVEPKK